MCDNGAKKRIRESAKEILLLFLVAGPLRPIAAPLSPHYKQNIIDLFDPYSQGKKGIFLSCFDGFPHPYPSNILKNLKL